MDIILNDYSLDGQFNSIEDFVLWIHDEWMDMFSYLLEKKVNIYKKTDFYTRKVTKDKTLEDLLKISGDPLISMIKTFIIKSAYSSPYWDEAGVGKTELNNTYKCPCEDELPNCFSEAIERDKTVLSIKNNNYLDKYIFYYKNNEEGKLFNIVEYRSFLLWLLESEMADVKYVFENYGFDRDVTFVDIAGKCYAEEAIQHNNLTLGDKKNILFNISNLIKSLSTGTKSRFVDKISDDLFEYRMSVSAGREFRLFFIQKDGVIAFLNGFIKKQQKTPDYELDKARMIKREFLQ